MKLVMDIINSGEQRFSGINEKLVDTRSNLNFSTLSDICRVCGVEVSKFEESAFFIDVVIVKRRNAIAHGEDALVDIAEIDEIAEKTIGLMRLFGTEIENQVALRDYRAP